MRIGLAVKRLLRKTGFDVIRFEPKRYPTLRRRMLLDNYAVNVVLDVGANTGQYATQLRRSGYVGRIVSFEPMRFAFDRLHQATQQDAQWQAFNFALGEATGETEINIAGNSISSSIRPMLRSHVDSSPQSTYVGKEKIQLKTLDEVLPRVCDETDRIWLKIDTQGFEKDVLLGGMNSLLRIDTIQLEMSLVPLYEGQALFGELYTYLFDLGYRMVGIEPGFEDQASGQLLQVDGIFHRFFKSPTDS